MSCAQSSSWIGANHRWKMPQTLSFVYILLHHIIAYPSKTSFISLKFEMNFIN